MKNFILSFLIVLVAIQAHAFSFKAVPAAPNPGVAIGETADTTNVRFFAEDCSCISPASIETDASFTESTNIVRWNQDTQPYNDGVCVCRIDIPSTGDYCVWPYYRGGGSFLVGLSDVRSYIPRFWTQLPQRDSYGFNASAVTNLNLTPKKIAVGSSGEQNLYIQGSNNTRLGAVYFGKVDGSGNCTATPSLPAGEAPFTPDYLLQTIDPAPTINGNFTGEDDWVNAVNFPIAQTNNNTIDKATCLWNDTANRIFCGFEILDDDIQTGGSTITTRDRVEFGICPDTEKTTPSTDCAKYIVDFLGNTDSKKWSGTGFTTTFTANMSASVADIAGGKRIEVGADLPTNFSPNQRGLIQFANPDRETGGTTTIALAYGSGNLNSISQWGTTLASTTQPTAPPPCSTQPTVTSTSETDITDTSARLCVNGVDITCASQAIVVWEWGTTSGNYNLTQSTNQTVSDGGSVCQLVQNLPSSTQIFWRASVNDGVTATINTTEDSFNTLAANQFCVQASGGNNSNDGIFDGTPSCWATLAYGISQMDPGETLILRDGTYTEQLNITCGSNAVNGTQLKPITVKAENERAVFINRSSQGDNAVKLQNCQYWNIEGLVARSGDNSAVTGAGAGDVFSIDNNKHITLRRNVGAYPNRYCNCHVFSVGDNSVGDNDDILLEENEAYYFHRHGISMFGGTPTDMSGVILRRNYANSRLYPNLQAGFHASSHPDNQGDEGITFYLTDNSISENNIVENTEHFLGTNGGNNNKNLGNISINTMRGGPIWTYRSSLVSNSNCPDTYAENNIFVGGSNTTTQGMQYNACTGSIFNSSIFLTSATPVGMDIKDNSATTFTPQQAYEFRNMLIVGAGTTGIRDSGTNWASKILDYIRVSGFSTNFASTTNHRTNSSTTNPNNGLTCTSSNTPCVGMGTNQCLVYIPAGNTNLKGQGFNGEDIGANVIYRYQDGILTTTKLWDQTTGAFPCGATINNPTLGIVTNDANGSTIDTTACGNVHKRLLVGVNGCAIP